MAGYSGTPLPRKLGIKEGHKVVVLGAPDGFALDGVEFGTSLGKSPANVIVAFFTRAKDVAARFQKIASSLDPAGGFWVAWPKKSSGMATDLDENRIRDIGLEVGLVDNKVCAIDDTWSGLRFVVRVADRPKKR